MRRPKSYFNPNVEAWFNAQKPELKKILEYGRNDVDVTSSAIDEVRKTWCVNMEAIEHDIRNALRLYGRVSSIEIKACWNELLTMEVEVDISSRFNFDEISYRLSKLPWIHRVVSIDFDAFSHNMKIIIELNETGFNQERRNEDMGYGTTSYLKAVGVFVPQIDRVAFNGPATIVFWTDGTKTIVKCMEDEEFDPEKGLAMAICKRLYGGKFHKTFKDAIKNAKW